MFSLPQVFVVILLLLAIIPPVSTAVALPLANPASSIDARSWTFSSIVAFLITGAVLIAIFILSSSAGALGNESDADSAFWWMFVNFWLPVAAIAFAPFVMGCALNRMRPAWFDRFEKSASRTIFVFALVGMFPALGAAFVYQKLVGFF